MAGSSNEPTDLRALVTQGDPLSLRDAVDTALMMSVPAVEALLDEDFLADHAEQAGEFFSLWLPQMPPFERMAAARWVGSQSVLSMSHLEGARGAAARLTVEALSEASGALAEALENFWVLADGPDTEVPAEVGERLKELAAVVRDVRGQIDTQADHLR